MSSEAIDYIKQPAVKFLKDSYSLVNKCTKPDRNGACAGCSTLRSRAESRSGEERLQFARQRSKHTLHQRGPRSPRGGWPRGDNGRRHRAVTSAALMGIERTRTHTHTASPGSGCRAGGRYSVERLG